MSNNVMDIIQNKCYAEDLIPSAMVQDFLKGTRALSNCKLMNFLCALTGNATDYNKPGLGFRYLDPRDNINHSTVDVFNQIGFFLLFLLFYLPGNGRAVKNNMNPSHCTSASEWNVSST